MQDDIFHVLFHLIRQWTQHIFAFKKIIKCLIYYTFKTFLTWIILYLHPEGHIKVCIEVAMYY